MAVCRMDERLLNPKIRWYFTKQELENSPSRLHGVDLDKELSYRQQTANMIQEMGHRLKLNQICTATAIVYMHRFFMVHSFRTCNRWNIASAALFLAAKVEEQPQKLEYVVRVFYSCINRDQPNIDPTSEKFTKLVEEITNHELLILETLGFDLAVEHAHPHVVKCTQMVRASKDLSQTAYFMAHNSLLLTTFCLEHRPTVVACICINLACVWKGIEIPPSQDQKKWWEYMDSQITQELLDSLTKEFLRIYGKCPSKLQKKITEQIKLAQKQNKELSSQGGEKTTRGITHNKNIPSTSTKHIRPQQPLNQPQKSTSAHHSANKPHPQDRQSKNQQPSEIKHVSHLNSAAMKLAAVHGKPNPTGVHSLSSGKGSSSVPANKHMGSKLSGSSSQLINNKYTSKLPHEGHRGQTERSLHKHQVLPGSRIGEKQQGIGSDQKNRFPKHGIEHHNHDSHTTSHTTSRTHSQAKPNKRPHSVNVEVSDKKRVKSDSYHHVLPPLPPMSSMVNPPPPLPQSHSDDYSSSLPPLPPYPPPTGREETPPPPPPHS